MPTIQAASMPPTAPPKPANPVTEPMKDLGKMSDARV